jgi:hypothetical protein
MTKRLGRLAARLVILLSAMIGAAAIYYSTIAPDQLRFLLTAIVFVALSALLLIRSLWMAAGLWILASAAFMTWYLTDPPRNDRDWALEYAVMSSWSRDGQVIRMRNVRNFAYRGVDDITPAYYDAAYALDHLSEVDLVTSYWAGDTIAHVFVSFGFTDGRHLAFSIETRRQKAFGYSTIAGLFHHYELFYVVADERDLIGVRTDIRHERVYLYRLDLSKAAREKLFLSYLNEVQRLATRPAWYNTIADNCTTGILARADAKPRLWYNWRILLSGYAAEFAYQNGLLDRSQPFQMLKARSLIRRTPGQAIGADYSSQIRHLHS